MRGAARVAATYAVLQLCAIGVSRACTCSETLDEADYDVVFVGEVAGSSGCGGQGYARFEVEEVRKGVAVGEVLSVGNTPDNGKNCGTAFASGESWEVYAYEVDGELMTDGCSVRQR